jgi:hypothetical protein
MSPKAFVALLAAVALLQVAAAQGGPVVEWLKNNKETTTAGALLGQLYPKPISDKARFTILAPTNEVRLGTHAAQQQQAHCCRCNLHSPQTGLLQ